MDAHPGHPSRSLNSPKRSGAFAMVLASMVAWTTTPTHAQFAPPVVYARDRADTGESQEGRTDRPRTAGLREHVRSRLARLEAEGKGPGCPTQAKAYCSAETCVESMDALRDYRDRKEGAASRLANLYPDASRGHTTCIGWMMDWPQVDGPAAREIRQSIGDGGNDAPAAADPPVAAAPENAESAALQGTLAQKLAELEEARERGLLSDEEFEALRKNVLSRF